MSLKGFVIGHNTGLGDQIIMNGAARYVADCYDKVWYVTWANRAKHAEFLYRDCDNIEIYVKPSIASTRQGVMRMEAAYREIVENNPDYEFPPYKRGYYSAQKDWKRFSQQFGFEENTIFPRIFYEIMGVPYDVRYKFQKITRDFTRERKLYESLVKHTPVRKPYAFCVNDSRSSKYTFDFQTDLPIINPLDFPFWKDTLLYDWQFAMENAAEIHMVNTSWFHLAKTLRMNKPKYYYAAREVEMCEQNDEFLNDDFDSGWTLVRPRELRVKDKRNWWLN